MPYMLLIHEPLGQRQTRSRAEGEAVYDRMLRFSDELRKRGVLRAAESLESPDANTVRIKVGNGRSQVLDGPFAEAKEMVGGIYLLDVDSREEALVIAAQCPAAEWAEIEVRACAPCYT